MGEEISIDNPDNVSRVRMILKVLDSSPAFDFFDQSFNEYSPEGNDAIRLSLNLSGISKTGRPK